MSLINHVYVKHTKCYRFLYHTIPQFNVCKVLHDFEDLCTPCLGLHAVEPSDFISVLHENVLMTFVNTMFWIAINSTSFTLSLPPPPPTTDSVLTVTAIDTGHLELKQLINLINSVRILFSCTKRRHYHNTVIIVSQKICIS